MSERIQQVIEALGRYKPCDEDGSVCVANRLAVEEARAMLGEYAAEVARLRVAHQWKPIETAPKDNKRPLLLARFNDDGLLQSIDYDGMWRSDRESWELPEVYYYWATATGNVEEPSHWMYQPDWYAAIDAARNG